MSRCSEKNMSVDFAGTLQFVEKGGHTVNIRTAVPPCRCVLLGKANHGLVA